jgi:hypothetical protein
MTKSLKYKPWLSILFSRLHNTYEFFIKEHLDAYELQKRQWYFRLKKFTEEEIMSAFSDVVKNYPDKHPNHEQYARVIVHRQYHSWLDTPPDQRPKPHNEPPRLEKPQDEHEFEMMKVREWLDEMKRQAEANRKRTDSLRYRVNRVIY